MKIANTLSKQLSFMHKCMLSVVAVLIFSAGASAQTAQQGPAPEAPGYFSNTLFVSMFVAICLLLLVIAALAQVVKAAAKNKMDQERAKSGAGKSILSIALLIAAMGMSTGMFAQGAAAAAPAAPAPADPSIMGLDQFTFYLMLTIIVFEFFVVWKMYSLSMEMLGVAERKKQIIEENLKLGIHETTLLDKMNASVAIENEADVMMDHDYDGIKELDNNLPPWWKYGFYLTILFAFAYLVNYHITKTGKLQLAEYEEQIALGKKQVEEYKAKASNLVDENTVTIDKSADVLAAGKNTFLDNCAACHGKNAEGGVGPNLTDDYWLHGGTIKNIFRTIKLGWPEKGMKAWEQDLGAKQIAEVANYIKSLHGTNPPNAKEKQGDLFVEEGQAPAADSTGTVAADSLKMNDSLKTVKTK